MRCAIYKWQPGGGANAEQAFDVLGHVDSLTKSGVMCWAWVSATPDKAAKIRAVVGGGVVGRATGEHLRQDLADGGKGTGLYGFMLRFSKSLSGDRPAAAAGA